MSGTPATWVILGCGYTGTQLARTLVAHPGLAATVTVTRRDADVARALGAALGARGERAELAELGRPGGLALPAGAIVVCTAPPGPDPAGEIRALVAAARDAARIVYVSSTGVYGPGGGAWVDESWPIAPITESGRGLAERIRAGAYRVIGDGKSHVSRIHVVDLVAAILAAAASTLTGPVNAADDDPAPIGEVADQIAARLGVPPPPRVPIEAVSPEVAGMLTADRRIANRRLRDELGVALRYPSWRIALDEELR